MVYIYPIHSSILYMNSTNTIDSSDMSIITLVIAILTFISNIFQSMQDGHFRSNCSISPIVPDDNE